MGIDNVLFSKPGYAKWTVVSKGEGVHHVYGPDGSRYGTYATPAQARATAVARQREEDRAARRMTRPCMTCTRPFASEGIHNRMCASCRGLGEGAVPYGVAPRSGRPR